MVYYVYSPLHDYKMMGVDPTDMPLFPSDRINKCLGFMGRVLMKIRPAAQKAEIPVHYMGEMYKTPLFFWYTTRTKKLILYLTNPEDSRTPLRTV